ncbi:MAG: hypothetical protein GEEBNDBF_00451 [bacterium]|nr:hypothetical protein [bacterium]
MLLSLALDPAGQRVLVVGTGAEAVRLASSLQVSGAQVTVLEEPYARRFLTPRPWLIILGITNSAESQLVEQEARDRGILLVRCDGADPRPGQARLSL